MNLILVFESDFVSGTAAQGEGRVRLEGRRAAYVQSIHRAVPGDGLCVGLCGGAIGRGQVVGLADDAVELEVRLERPPPRPLPLTLVLALPRPLVLKRVLIAATAMGCKRIFLIQASRVERSFWNSKVLRAANLRESLVLGLEQAVDTILPTIAHRTRFRPFVEDELPALVAGTRGLVAHPEAKLPCPYAVGGPITLLMGPEGGFVPFEIERLEAAGCQGVHLGERILRVETALPFLVARLF